MPHIVYFAPYILCPWKECGFRIELLDFQLEKSSDPVLYARVMSAWGHDPDFGVIARCPGCHNYVMFGLANKRTIGDPSATTYPLLPDDWHNNALIG